MKMALNSLPEQEKSAYTYIFWWLESFPNNYFYAVKQLSHFPLKEKHAVPFDRVERWQFSFNRVLLSLSSGKKLVSSFPQPIIMGF